jgi:hypothetical protein
MNRKLTLVVSLMMLMAAVLLSAPIARADALSVTITSPVYGRPGDVVSIFATITNIGPDTAYLNGDSFSLAGSGTVFSVDDTPFFTNAPFFMASGDSIMINILDVTIQQTATLGTYNGLFWILGDTIDQGGLDNLNGDAGSPFQVQVVPEPASMLLLGTGLTSMIGAIRRKRQS